MEAHAGLVGFDLAKGRLPEVVERRLLNSAIGDHRVGQLQSELEILRRPTHADHEAIIAGRPAAQADVAAHAQIADVGGAEPAGGRAAEHQPRSRGDAHVPGLLFKAAAGEADGDAQRVLLVVHETIVHANPVAEPGLEDAQVLGFVGPGDLAGARQAGEQLLGRGSAGRGLNLAGPGLAGGGQHRFAGRHLHFGLLRDGQHISPVAAIEVGPERDGDLVQADGRHQLADDIQLLLGREHRLAVVD